jgi:hypothetical protein
MDWIGAAITVFGICGFIWSLFQEDTFEGRFARDVDETVREMERQRDEAAMTAPRNHTNGKQEG